MFRDVLRLLANQAQRFSGCGDLFRMGVALGERFLGKLRGQIARQPFELRRQLVRQVSLQRFRRGILRCAIACDGFFLNSLERRGDFARELFSRGSNFLLPRIGADAPLGGYRLRRRFPGGCMNLLPCIREQPGDLPRQLHGGVRGAREGGEDAQLFRTAGGAKISVTDRKTEFRFWRGMLMQFLRFFHGRR